MSKVKRRTTVARHTVRNRVFDVERIDWRNTDGLSFDVYDVATGVLLTPQSLDDEPGPAEIEDLLDRLAEEFEADTLDPLFFPEMDLRTILRRWNGAYGHCRICGLQAGPDYHLAGGIPNGENPIVCDQCWDERLR
jgi:hypothetical protein